MNNTNAVKDKNPKRGGSSSKSEENIYKHSYVFFGIFAILAGVFLLLHNLIGLPRSFSSVLLVLAALYLIILATLKLIHKVYFVIGLVFLSFSISILIQKYTTRTIIWIVVMCLVGVGIIIYGNVFKKNKVVKYIVPGVFIIAMAIFIAVLLFTGKEFIPILVKSWPLFIVVFGIQHIYTRYHIHKVQKKLSDISSEEDEHQKD